MGISIPHLTVVLVIIILVFGTKHLKSLGGDLGFALKSLRSAINEEQGQQHSVSTDLNNPAKQPTEAENLR